MNNIYVDELPKKCWDCKYLRDRVECGLYCRLDAFDEDYDYTVGVRHKNCPLKLVTDRLAGERKKVVQEIRDKIKQTYPTCYVSLGEEMFNSQMLTIEMKSLTKILDQIERNE